MVNADDKSIGIVTHWGRIAQFLGGKPPLGYNANPCEVIETIWAPVPPGFKWSSGQSLPPGTFFVAGGQPLDDGRVWVCKFVRSHGYPGEAMVKAIVNDIFGGNEE